MLFFADRGTQSVGVSELFQYTQDYSSVLEKRLRGVVVQQHVFEEVTRLGKKWVIQESVLNIL